MEDIKFEVALKRLEEIVTALEKGEEDLDKSLSLFQEGVDLVKVCETKLKEIEDKTVKILDNHDLKDFKI